MVDALKSLENQHFSSGKPAHRVSTWEVEEAEASCFFLFEASHAHFTDPRHCPFRECVSAPADPRSCDTGYQ